MSVAWSFTSEENASTDVCLLTIASTVVIHSFLGRPTLGTYLEVAGMRAPGMSDEICTGLDVEALSTLPRRSNCLLVRMSEAFWCPALHETSAFDTQE